MFAIFNQSQDADRRDESPTIPVLSGTQIQQQEQLNARITQLEDSLSAPSSKNKEALAKWEAGLTARDKQWQLLDEVSVKASSGATFTRLNDGSYLVSGKSAPTDTYTIEGIARQKAITAIRIDFGVFASSFH